MARPKKSEKYTPVAITYSDKDEDSPTAHFRFPNTDDLEEVVGDLGIDEEIVLTVTGKISSLDINRGKSFQYASLELDNVHVIGETVKAKNRKDDIEDMEDYANGKNPKNRD